MGDLEMGDPDTCGYSFWYAQGRFTCQFDPAIALHSRECDSFDCPAKKAALLPAVKPPKKEKREMSTRKEIRQKRFTIEFIAKVGPSSTNTEVARELLDSFGDDCAYEIVEAQISFEETSVLLLTPGELNGN